MCAFQGPSRHSLDDKARLILPRAVARQLEEKPTEMVATASPDGCLLILDREELTRLASASARSVFGPERERLTSRLLWGHAETIEPDKTGRVVLSDALRTFAEIKANEQVWVIGKGTHLEVWSAKRWQEELSLWREWRKLFAEHLQPEGKEATTVS